MKQWNAIVPTFGGIVPCQCMSYKRVFLPLTDCYYNVMERIPAENFPFTENFPLNYIQA